MKVVGFGYVEELVPIFDRELATDNPRWGVFIINKSLRRQFQYHLARNPLMVTCVIQKLKKEKEKAKHRTAPKKELRWNIHGEIMRSCSGN